MVEFEALITEAGSAVSTAFSGLQGLWGFTELTHHSHNAQAHCVPVSRESKRNRERSCSEVFVHLSMWFYSCRYSNTQGKLGIQDST